MTDERVAIDGVDERTRQRFKEVKHRSQSRTGTDYLTHDEFMNMLLDVWELDERDRDEDYTASARGVSA